MLYTSYSFLVFFLVVLLVSRSLRSWTGRKAVLLVSSYLFYASWSPPFIVLIWFSTLLDWFSGRMLYASATSAKRRLFLGLSLAGNLGVLGYFKYSAFFIESMNSVLAALLIPFQAGKPDVMLPIGISFYTFQTLSYMLDLYRGQREPCRKLLDYALYVSFFPELVAGPILRSRDFLPQCEEPRKGNAAQIGWGSVLIVTGLFCKIVVADGLMAPIADRVFGSASAPGFLSGWAGTLAFSVQLFCDFFGYSTCAVGVALALGFVLPDNFRFPYAAIGFSDFWRRWHITLSTWLRDYIFLPSAYSAARHIDERKFLGIRVEYTSYAIAAMVTMFAAGLWHGASWMFIIWGGLHGLYLIVERFLMKSRLGRLALWRSTAGRVSLALVTYFFVCVAWLFFRAETLSRALSMLGDMVDVGDAWKMIAARVNHVSTGGLGLWLGGPDYVIAFAVAALLFCVHWILRETSLEAAFANAPGPLRVAALTLMLATLLVSMTGEDRAFFYFQF